MKSTGRLWLLAVCLLCGLVCTQAQEQEKKQLPREVPSPEKAARKMTDRMKEELQLTDKQYDKLYKLNLKEQQEHFATKKIRKILTTEQYAKWQEMRQPQEPPHLQDHPHKPNL